MQRAVINNLQYEHCGQIKSSVSLVSLSLAFEKEKENIRQGIGYTEKARF